MIRNVVFDIGGVLIDFDPRKAFKRYGLAGQELEDVLNATVGNKLWRELDRAVMDEADVVAQMKECVPKLGAAIDWFFDEGVKTVVTCRGYAVDWLKDLAKRGADLYLLSNYPPRLFEMHRQKEFRFMPLTKGRIVSGYVKVIKPDPAIYHMLLDKYSLKAEECIFIDDVLENVETANALSMHGVHFTKYIDTADKVLEMIEEQNA